MDASGVAQAETHQHIRSLIMQKNFPCVAAVQSLALKDYEIVEGRCFGSGRDSASIRQGILDFLETWKASRSTTSTLWITYPKDSVTSEDDFEKRFWDELSHLSSVELSKTDWAEGWSADPNDRNFTLCIGGFAFFVVGLHPHASRPGRKFPHPAIVMNVFDQFEDLEAKGQYVPMVQKNRERDVKFSGSVNPMAEKFGDGWEAIQFSGKTHDEAWKCPFHFKK